MRTIHWIPLPFCCVAAAAIYSFVASARDAEQRRLCTPLCALRPSYANANRSAPDFELPRLGGGSGKLSDYRGRVVLMNFWSRTCRPCLAEMPSLAELARTVEGEPGVAVLTVNIDESAEAAHDALLSVLGSEPRFVTFLDTDGVVLDKYGTKLFPETWIIDGSGVIRSRFDGQRNWMNPLYLEHARSVAGPLGCPIVFTAAAPHGALAPLCDELPRAL
jgi:thiol-disulfide isomerase/thioredoxin